MSLSAKPSLAELEAVFHAAEALSGAAREAFLTEACRGRDGLRAQVDQLLAASALPDDLGGVRIDPVGEGGTALVEEPNRAGTRIGAYRILERLGEGGCGVVYMAEQLEPVRRRVALKVIKPGMDTRAVVARFEAERQALAIMEHPNIARVFEAGSTPDGRPYFVMELVRGRNITDHCDHHRLRPRERLGLLLQICHAVQHAHQKGIIHRDLKPSNILISVDNGVAIPKVIDFGIAKATQQPLTEKTLFTGFNQFLGTPAYMSPEQAEFTNLDVDTRSDIYSLGVLLYELLTGHTPFDPKQLLRLGLDEVRRTIREVEPPRPSARLSTLQAAERSTLAAARGVEPLQLTTALKGDLDWIVMRCLEKDRTRRYDTANSLAEDLRRFLAEEPVLARPPSAWYRFQKLVRRHRAATVAAGAVGVALLLGIATAGWQWRKSEHQRAVAELNNYVGSLGLAEQELREGRIFLARERLLQQPERLRGWEWGRLMAQAHPELLTVPLLTNDVRNFGLEPVVLRPALAEDGSMMAVMSEGEIRVYRVRDGQLVKFFGGTNAPAYDGAFNPKSEGFLTAGPGPGWTLWNTATWTKVWQTGASSNPERSASFSADGSTIVTCSREDRVTLLRASDGGVIRQIKAARALGGAWFSDDGKRIVSMRAANRPGETQCVWDSQSGELLAEFPPEPQRYTHSSCASTADRYATADTNGVIAFWYLGKNEPEFQTPPKGAQRVFQVLACPNLPRVAALTDPSQLHVWDCASRSEITTVDGFAFGAWSSPNGKWLITGSGQPYLRVWDWDLGMELFRISSGRPAVGTAVSFTRNGHFIAASSEREPAVQVWPLEPPDPILRDPWMAFRADISPDGKRVALARMFAGIILYDAETGRRTHYLNGHWRWVSEVRWSPDGKRLYSSGCDNTVRVWDAGTGEQLRLLAKASGPVAALSVSPDEKKIAGASFDGAGYLWESATGKVLQKWQVFSDSLDQKYMIFRMGFDPSGRYLAMTAAEGKGGVWDAETGQQLLRFATDPATGEQAFALAWAHDGSRLVTMDASGRKLRFWRTGDWRLLQTAEGRLFGNEMQFSADDQRLFVGTMDSGWSFKGNTSVDVYDGHSGRFLVSLGVRQGNSLSVRLSADGRRMVRGLWANERDGSGPQIWDTLPWHNSEYAGATDEPLPERISRYARERLWKRVEHLAPQVEPPDLPWVEPRSDWPARAPQTPVQSIDLTDAYNAHLDTGWEFSGSEDSTLNTLHDLPQRLVQLDGVPWDIRGMVATGRPEPLYLRNNWPAEKGVFGIRIQQPCAKIHFLHASSGVAPNLAPQGGIKPAAPVPLTTVGRYRFHFEDGSTFDLPLRDGENIAEWWAAAGEKKASAATVAWEGENKLSHRSDRKTHLYHYVWNNPFPGKKIVSFDLIPEGTPVVPFLIAVTIE